MGYQEQANGVGSGLCSFARRLLELDDDDAAAVFADLENTHVSNSEVWRKLRMGRTDGETPVGYATLCLHRKESCACVAL